MCGSKNHNNGGFCCPDPQIFVEKNCGNLKGPRPVAGEVTRDGFSTVWNGPADGDYFQGTFEVFNCGPEGNIEFRVGGLVDATGAPVTITVTPGNSITVSVNDPANFRVRILSAGTSGKFCITLYKRVLC
ncbi:S-Ena type endospore appendage [Peribacillus acanthi]|uniref:S-Ena type endospore appendage n=1 Tax=Peribacillus acanthi TaxID=2171554 RepID=UPI000D3E881E|nr:S-Ena type endospore appendage [Peribacillus acanthi]